MLLAVEPRPRNPFAVNFTHLEDMNLVHSTFCTAAVMSLLFEMMQERGHSYDWLILIDLQKLSCIHFLCFAAISEEALYPDMLAPSAPLSYASSPPRSDSSSPQRASQVVGGLPLRVGREGKDEATHAQQQDSAQRTRVGVVSQGVQRDSWTQQVCEAGMDQEGSESGMEGNGSFTWAQVLDSSVSGSGMMRSRTRSLRAVMANMNSSQSGRMRETFPLAWGEDSPRSCDTDGERDAHCIARRRRGFTGFVCVGV